MVVVRKGKRLVKRKAKALVYRQIRLWLLTITMPIVAGGVILFLKEMF